MTGHQVVQAGKGLSLILSSLIKTVVTGDMTHLSFLMPIMTAEKTKENILNMLIVYGSKGVLAASQLIKLKDVNDDHIDEVLKESAKHLIQEHGMVKSLSTIYGDNDTRMTIYEMFEAMDKGQASEIWHSVINPAAANKEQIALSVIMTMMDMILKKDVSSIMTVLVKQDHNITIDKHNQVQSIMTELELPAEFEPQVDVMLSLGIKPDDIKDNPELLIMKFESIKMQFGSALMTAINSKVSVDNHVNN